MAKEYLTHNVVNRKPCKGQIEYYARMMGNGTWLLNGESIVFDNKGNLSDGQHRLMACIMANVPFQSVVVRNVDCEAFTTFDQGKARSAGDCFSIKGIPNSTNVSAAIRKFIIMNRYNVHSLDSTRQSNNGEGISKVSSQEHLSEYEQRAEFWQDEIMFSRRCYDRLNKVFSVSDVAGISAFLILTKGYNAEVVHDFFSQLFFEECTENNTLALFRRMLVNDLIGGKIKMTSLYKTQLLIKCWNAYKTNKEYKTLRWVKEVEGTYSFE